MKKTLALVLAFMMVLTSGVALAAADYPWLDDSIIESSTLPTWEGKQLTMVYWNAHGVNTMPDEVSPKDVVEPEIARVTGVTIDAENSFTNGAGMDFGARLPMIAASGDWPHLIVNCESPVTLMQGGVLVDLTDYITPEYLPGIFNRAPKDDPLFAFAWRDPNTMLDGRYYAVPQINIQYDLIRDRVPLEGEDRAKYETAFERPTNFRPAAYVIRDDVSKALFPESKTMDEIEALYMEKGYFDYDDVFDIPIKSPEDFYQMLRDIDALGLVENNQKVYATFTGACFDSYLMGARLANGLFGYGSARDPWTYWDNVEQKILYSGFQDDQRSLFREFNKLIREDVVSPESLIEDATMFMEKMNNGMYAFSFAEWAWPNNEIIEARKEYRYRPIFFDIPFDTNRYVPAVGAPHARDGSLMFFKDTVAEEDLPQIMSWIDYHYSMAYQYTSKWGPESAGLFYTKENGKRAFHDQELADAILYNTNVALTMEYNLNNGFFNVNYRVRRLQFGSHIAGALSFPYMHYDDIARNPGTARDVFKSGLVDDYTPVVSNLAWIWNFPNTNEEIDSVFSKNRKMVEDMMMRSLAATTDEEFEARYDEYISYTKSVGATDETMAAITDYFINDYNKDFMDNLRGAIK